MKTLVKSALFFLTFLFLPNLSNASHIYGGMLRYEYVGAATNDSSVYKIIFDVIYEFRTNTSNLTNTVPVGIYDASSNKLINSIMLDSIDKQHMDVSTHKCLQANVTAALRATLSKFVTLKNNSSGYHIIHDKCCLAEMINVPDNSSNEQDQGLRFYNYIPSYTFKDNSPLMSEDSLRILCRLYINNLNLSTIDPDGDSLVYSIIRPYNGGDITEAIPSPDTILNFPFDTILYRSGFSSEKPLGPESIAELNSKSGIARIRTTEHGSYIFGILIKSFRNGVYLSSVTTYMNLFSNQYCYNDWSNVLDSAWVSERDISYIKINWNTISGCFHGNDTSLKFKISRRQYRGFAADDYTSPVILDTVLYSQTYFIDSTVGCGYFRYYFQTVDVPKMPVALYTDLYSQGICHISATALSSDSILVDWDRYYISHYRNYLLRTTDTSLPLEQWDSIKVSNGINNSYYDTGLIESTTYYYRFSSQAKFLDSTYLGQKPYAKAKTLFKTSIHKGLLHSFIQIYPNPVGDEFTVKVNVAVDELFIYDNNGKQVKKIVTDGQKKLSVSTFDLEPGVYYITASANGVTYRNKLVKLP